MSSSSSSSSRLLVEAPEGKCSGWCFTKSVSAMYGNYTSAGPASTQVYGTQFTSTSGPSAVASPAVESLMFTVPPPPSCPARHDSCTACISCTSCGRGAHHYHHSPTPTLASVSPTCASTQSEEDRTLALQLRAAAIFNKTDVAVSGAGLGGPATTLTLPPPSSASFPYPPPSHLTPFSHPVQSCDTSPGQYCTCSASPSSNCSSSSSPLPSCPYHSFAVTSATTTTTTCAAVATPFYPNTVMSSLSNTDFASKTAPATTTSTTAYLDSPSPSGQSCQDQHCSRPVLHIPPSPVPSPS